MHIVIIEPDLATRRSIISLLRSTKQGPTFILTELSDCNEFKSFKNKNTVDCIFISTNPGKHVTGPEFIRYLTRTEQINAWCKCVLTSTEENFQQTTSVYRQLEIPVLTLPSNVRIVEEMILNTLSSARVFKPFLQVIRRLPPNELVKRLSKVKSEMLSETGRNELILLKIQIILMARRPEKAIQMAERLSHAPTRMRELLYIRYYTGDKEELEALLDDESNHLTHTQTYYKALLCIHEQDYTGAESTLRTLDPAKMRFNELETLALLMTKQENDEAAQEMLKSTFSAVEATNELRYEINATRLRCLGLQLMRSPDSPLPKQSFLELKEELSAFEGTDEDTVRNKQIILMAMFLLNDRNTALAVYEKLMAEMLSFDLGQLNILLLAANLFEKDDDAIMIHRQLDKHFSRLEISPEMLSFEIFYSALMKYTLNREQRLKRLLTLASSHLSGSRYYRALQKYNELLRYGEDISSFQSQVDKVLTATDQNTYWSLRKSNSEAGESKSAEQ